MDRSPDPNTAPPAYEPAEAAQDFGPAEPDGQPVPPATVVGRWLWALIVLLTFALLLCTVAAWRTNDAMASVPFLRGNYSAADHAAAQATHVDQTPWKTAIALAALATTQEEQVYARQAEHLADHDVDQAFAAALRNATLRQHTLSGEALALQQQVTVLEAAAAADTDAVKQLTSAGGDDLEVAQAQLGLDQDELSDARQDLARATGDQRGAIQQELVARQAEVKKFDSGAGNGQGAVSVARQYRTLARFAEVWLGQRQRSVLLLQAQAASQHLAASFVAQHNGMEAAKKGQMDRPASPSLASAPSQAGKAAPNTSDSAARVARLKRLSLERQLMSTYDDRIDTETQLAAVYSKWAAQVALQHRIVAHLIAVQCIYVVLILLAAIAAGALVDLIAGREVRDRRRLRTLSRILRLGVQAVAMLAILLVVFGPPERLSTVVGLTTAGLTVALQDFILGFVGWFLLMGRNGLAVGDAVEINAVTGQVVEVGLFRTTLLETGNWTAKGHPTGRRVAFNNKFAISGQFFNFSTSGQWMWDELTVGMPAGQDTPAVIERVRKVVSDETESDALQAEAEWSRSSLQHGLSRFSAGPDVNLRPSAAGFDVVVRYITRATGRFERRNKLYACVIAVLAQATAEPEPAAA